MICRYIGVVMKSDEINAADTNKNLTAQQSTFESTILNAAGKKLFLNNLESSKNNQTLKVNSTDIASDFKSTG